MAKALSSGRMAASTTATSRMTKGRDKAVSHGHQERSMKAVLRTADSTVKDGRQILMALASVANGKKVT